MSPHTNNDLSEEQILAIAKKAVQLAMEELPDKVAAKLEDRFFIRVGKAVVTKLLYIAGVVAVGGYIWLQSHGAIPKE